MSRLYLGKLNNVSQHELSRIVSQYGPIVDFLMKEKYAFVQYCNEPDAQLALSELDGKLINGQRILCEIAKPKNEDNTGYFLTHPRIYIGRLNNAFTKDEIYNMFVKYGEIVDFLYKDEYAFVEFKHIISANKAISEMHSCFIKGTRLVVEEARPKEAEEGGGSKRLFIGKIGPNVKKQDILKSFGTYGDIVDILLKEDFAFVEYSNNFSSKKAIDAMNNARLCGSRIVVEEARPKENENKLATAQPQLPQPKQQQSNNNSSRTSSANPSTIPTNSFGKLKNNNQMDQEQMILPISMNLPLSMPTIPQILNLTNNMAQNQNINNNNGMLNSSSFNNLNMVSDSPKTKQRRKSPKRSISRSRSRSLERIKV